MRGHGVKSPGSTAAIWAEQKEDDWSWRIHDHDQVVHALIMHVAIADIDATYGAYVAATTSTFNKTNNSNQNAKNKNNRNYSAYPWSTSYTVINSDLRQAPMSIPSSQKDETLRVSVHAALDFDAPRA